MHQNPARHEGEVSVGVRGWLDRLSELIADAKHAAAKRELASLTISWDERVAIFLRKESTTRDIPRWLNREFKLGGFTRNGQSAIFLKY